MRKRLAFGALATIAALAVAVPVVRNDPGGSVREYTRIAERPSRIEGRCDSACTLRLKTGCVTPTARLGFHSPRAKSGTLPLPQAEWERVTRHMASHYPPRIAAWFLAGPRHSLSMTYLTGAQAIAMGARRC